MGRAQSVAGQRGDVLAVDQQRGEGEGHVRFAFCRGATFLTIVSLAGAPSSVKELSFGKFKGILGW
jgi:hypothetical protein